MLAELSNELLVVGLGSGVTLASALAHPAKQVDIIEISPEIVDASTYFSLENHNCLADHTMLGTPDTLDTVPATLDTAAQGLDEARSRIADARQALQAALEAQDAKGRDLEPLRQALVRLGRVAAEVERVEGVLVVGV